jgi:hypothetical protein
MAYKKINNTTRALIIARLLTGVMPAIISSETGVSEATISRLKRKIPDEVLLRFETERQSLEAERAELERKKNSIPNLIEQHLVASLIAAAKIMQQVHDPEWIAKQSAAELAVLYGVTSDKAFRILEAIERANEQRELLKAQNGNCTYEQTQHECAEIGDQ